MSQSAAGDGLPGVTLLPGGEPVASLLRRAQFFTPGTGGRKWRKIGVPY